MSGARWAVLLVSMLGVTGCTCEIETARLPEGAVNLPYLARLEESSACGNGVWALASGTMPPGVSLFADGRMSGTPNTAGTFSFTVAFQEGGVANSPGRTAEKSFTIAVRF
jgi:large repetitive protein